MRYYLIIALLQIIKLSCFAVETNVGFTGEYDSIVNVEKMDKAYQKHDTIVFNEFFKEWHQLSLKCKMMESNDTITHLEKIFKEVYHPFKLEKYGWLPREHYSKYRYAILPSNIRYAFVDFIDIEHEYGQIECDTIFKFYPTVELDNAQVLYDDSIFGGVLLAFLSDDFHKKYFLEKWINMPISSKSVDYKTSPEVLKVIFNKQLDKSIVDLRLISTGLRISLMFDTKNDKWIIEQIKQLWIE